MKIFYTLLLISTSLVAFSQGNSPLNLKITNDLYYSRTPATNRNGINITLKSKVPTVLAVATDNSGEKRLNPNESFSNGKGRPAYLIVVPQLYDMADNGISKSFKFGRNSAENNFDDAVVKIFYNNGIPSPVGPMNRQLVNFGVSNEEIYTVSGANAPNGDLTGKIFLKVEASNSETATIEIDRQANRGNVIVGIFSAKNGNLLAKLNPKDPVNQESRIAFTTDETVIIVPLIRPEVNSADGRDTIRFMVGDPVENATAESIEE